MATQDFATVKQEVKRLVSQITEVSEDRLTDEAKFVEDLGVDSMMALEIVASIEKKYKVIIPEGEIPKISSLSNVYTLLQGILK